MTIRRANFINERKIKTETQNFDSSHYPMDRKRHFVSKLKNTLSKLLQVTFFVIMKADRLDGAERKTERRQAYDIHRGKELELKCLESKKFKEQ